MSQIKWNAEYATEVTRLQEQASEQFRAASQLADAVLRLTEERDEALAQVREWTTIANELRVLNDQKENMIERLNAPVKDWEVDTVAAELDNGYLSTALNHLIAARMANE